MGHACLPKLTFLCYSQKHDLMEHVAHQCICMQYILELSKQLDVDPRACVSSFFSRIQIAEVDYKNSFDDELKAFKDRIRKRAAEKVADALREAEEEEREARLGPGGLDPIEIFESLPKVRLTIVGYFYVRRDLCRKYPRKIFTKEQRLYGGKEKKRKEKLQYDINEITFLLFFFF